MNSTAPATAPPIPSSKLSYSIKEAVEATGISKASLYRDLSAGRLEMRKRGTATIILTEELRRYLAAMPVLETKQ